MAQLAGLLIYASGIKKNIILHLLPLKNSQVLWEKKTVCLITS